MSYKSGRSLLQAVKDKAKSSGARRDTVMRDFYMDRFLCRVFSEERPQFVLKGGQSMIAQAVSTRRTTDVDLLAQAVSIEDAVVELRRLGALDLGDLLEFRCHPEASRKEINADLEYAEGVRIKFTVVLDGIVRPEQISIDLVDRPVSFEDAVKVAPSSRVEVGDLPVFDYRVYPLELTFVDKACATVAMYGGGRPSSRIKDLVDMASIVVGRGIDPGPLKGAIVREKAIRHIPRGKAFSVPESWLEGSMPKSYRNLAEEAGLPEEYRDVNRAARLVESVLEGVFEDD